MTFAPKVAAGIVDRAASKCADGRAAGGYDNDIST